MHLGPRLRAGEPVSEASFGPRGGSSFIAGGLIDQDHDGELTGPVPLWPARPFTASRRPLQWRTRQKLRHRSAKNTYHQARDDGRPIDPEILRPVAAGPRRCRGRNGPTFLRKLRSVPALNRRGVHGPSWSQAIGTTKAPSEFEAERRAKRGSSAIK